MAHKRNNNRRRTKSTTGTRMKQAYEEALIELAENNPDIILIGPSKKFAKEHPTKHIKTGTLSQAEGMAEEGKIPYINTELNWEELRTICYNNANVKIISTNEIKEDIAITRILPNITVITPTDKWQAKKAIIAAGTTKGPVYIRLHNEENNLTQKNEFTIGRTEIIRAGKDCTIITSGSTLKEAIETADKLSKQEIECTILDNHTIKPIDKHAIITSAQLTGCIVTLEDTTNGLGSAIAELTSQNAPVPVKILGKEDVSRIIKAVKEAVMQKCAAACTTLQEQYAKRLHYELSPELHFKIQGGGTIKNIPELSKALINMNEETFTHHCNNHKNDFSTWVKEAFKQPALAKQIEKNHTRIGIILTLTRWLK